MLCWKAQQCEFPLSKTNPGEILHHHQYSQRLSPTVFDFFLLLEQFISSRTYTRQRIWKSIFFKRELENLASRSIAVFENKDVVFDK